LLGRVGEILSAEEAHSLLCEIRPYRLPLRLLKQELVIDQVRSFQFSFDDLLLPEDVHQPDMAILFRFYEIDALEEQRFFAVPDKKCIRFT